MRSNKLKAFTIVMMLLITGSLALIITVPDTIRGPPASYYHNSYIHLNVTKNDGSPADGFKATWSSYFSSSTTPTRFLDSNGEAVLNLTFDNLGWGYLRIEESSGGLIRYREFMEIGPDEHSYRNISLPQPITAYNNVSGIVKSGIDGSPLDGVTVRGYISDELLNSFPIWEVTGSDGRFSAEIPNSTLGLVTLFTDPKDGLLRTQHDFFLDPNVHQYEIEMLMYPEHRPDVLTRVRYLNGTGIPLTPESFHCSLYARDNYHQYSQVRDIDMGTDGWIIFNSSYGEGYCNYYGELPEYPDLKVRAESYLIHNGTEKDYEVQINIPEMVPVQITVHNDTDPIQGAGTTMNFYGYSTFGQWGLEQRNNTDSLGQMTLWFPKDEVVPISVYAIYHKNYYLEVDTRGSGPYSYDVLLEGSDPPRPEFLKNTMNITVVDNETGIPLPYAKVSGYAMNGSVYEYFSATVDSNGFWSGLAPVGTYYVLTATHNFGIGDVKDIVHTSDQASHIEIRTEKRSFTAREIGERYHFMLVDGSGEPVPNALVEVSCSITDGEISTNLVFSDPLGQVWLTAIPGTTITVYSVATINSNQRNPWAVPYTEFIAPSDSDVLPDVTVYPRSSMEPVIGVVRDSETLDPIPNAIISCNSVTWLSEEPTRAMPIGFGHSYFKSGVDYFTMAGSRSMHDGFYRTWGIETGIIFAIVPGYYPYTGEVQIDATRAETQFDILMDPLYEIYGWINGTLVDENDDPISGALFLKDIDHPAMGEQYIEVNETGEFSFQIYPGNYSVSYENETLTGSTEIVLSLNGIEDLILKLIPRSILGATVLNQQEEPVEGLNVTLEQDFVVLDMTMTNVEGEFSFLVPAGSYDILIESSQLYDAYSMDDIDMDGWTVLMTTIHLSNRTLADIMGTILGSSGPYIDGVPGVEVSVWNGETEVKSEFSDPNGDFEILNVLHGEYTLKATPPESLMPVEGIRSGYVVNTTMNFTVAGKIVLWEPVLEYVVNSPQGFVNITYYSPNGTDEYLDTPIVVDFSEVMDGSAVETAMVFEPALNNAVFSWDEWGYLLSIDHDPFEPNTTYEVTIGVGAVSIDGWSLFNNIGFSWNFTTGIDSDPWMISDATVALMDMNLSAEVTAPTNLSIYMMVSDLGFYPMDEISQGEYYLLINASEFDHDTSYSYYFTDRHNGDIKAPQFAGSFRTPESPYAAPDWEIIHADVMILDTGDWTVSVLATEDIDIYLVIEDVGSFKLVEGPAGTYEALVTYDNFEELEQYNYHFSDEEGGDDLAPMLSDSLVQPIRTPTTETDYVLSWWSVCVGSCLGVIILLILIIAVVVVIKKKGKSDRDFEEE